MEVGRWQMVAVDRGRREGYISLEISPSHLHFVGDLQMRSCVLRSEWRQQSGAAITLTRSFYVADPQVILNSVSRSWCIDLPYLRPHFHPSFPQ